MLDLLRAQRRGRFVENQQLCVGVQRAADLQQLLLAGLELGYHRAGIDVHAESGKQARRFRDHLLAVEETQLGFELAI